MGYLLQTSPFHVPVPGDKTIEEHFGFASILRSDISIAKMTAPAGWSEPFQTPEFDEFTIVVAGKKQIETCGEVIVLEAGQSILIEKKTRVRYSNPFAEPCEYVSVCLPAFSPATVHREHN